MMMAKQGDDNEQDQKMAAQQLKRAHQRRRAPLGMKSASKLIRADEREQIMNSVALTAAGRALATCCTILLLLGVLVQMVADPKRQVAGQQLSAGEKPKLIPLVAADSGYGENSSVNILCTVSQGHHESLQFDWFKDGQLIEGSPSPLATTSAELAADFWHPAGAAQMTAPQIEKHSDHSLLRISRVQANAHSGRYTCAAKNQFGQDSSSVNLLVNVKLQWIKEPAREVVVSLNQELKVDCLAEGEPRPTMRWEKLDSLQNQSGSIMQQQQRRGQTPGNQNLASANANNNKHRQQQTGNALLTPDQLNQSGGGYNSLESTQSLARGNQLASSGTGGGPNGYKAAHGHPHQHQRTGPPPPPPSSSSSSSSSSLSPSGGQIVSSSGQLVIQRARESDSGIYECIASNARDADLRKLVHVQVRGM